MQPRCRDHDGQIRTFLSGKASGIRQHAPDVAEIVRRITGHLFVQELGKAGFPMGEINHEVVSLYKKPLWETAVSHKGS